VSQKPTDVQCPPCLRVENLTLNEPLNHLITDISKYKVMLVEEADKKYGSAVVESGTSKRYFKITQTPVGRVLFLAYKGRKTMGLRGAYYPTVDALTNALGVKCVIENLEEQGYQIEIVNRRSAIKAVRDDDTFIAIVRYTGYDSSTIRRVFSRLISAGESSKLRVYVGKEKLDELNKKVWYKSSEKPEINPGTLEILTIPVQG